MAGRVAFICGARMAATRRDIYRNIRQAAETANAVAAKGYSVVIPHTMSTLPTLLGGPGESYWIANCRNIIFRLDPAKDVIVLVPNNWRTSENAKNEIKLAKERGIPVYELKDLPDD